MVSVGIVGILASVAIPTFQKQVLRTKTTERMTIMLRIKQAVEDYYVRNGTSIPTSLSSPVLGRPNPPGVPGMNRKPMSTAFPEWNAYFSAPAGSSVPFEIEGTVYYQYSFTVAETPTTATISILAQGDLDGDAALSTKSLTYTRVTGVYQILPGGEFPLPGQEDDVTFGTF
jgi:type II secretory pathway pseudopilin PulG